MPSTNEMKALVGATTRYISGRNAMQTSYWRSSAGTPGKMVKYNKTCEFDRSQKMPQNLQKQYFNQNFKAHKSDF